VSDEGLQLPDPTSATKPGDGGGDLHGLVDAADVHRDSQACALSDLQHDIPEQLGPETAS